MSETLRKRLTSYLGIAVIAMMVFGVLASTFQVPTARAVAGDGASSAITLLDTNANGKLDRITFSVANPNTETWSLTGASPNGFSVTDDGADITITTVSITSAADANPVLVQVNLDESDTDLSVDTANTGATGLELIYTQGNLGSNCVAQACLTDDTDEELNVIATGDSGGTDTEADGAAPQIASFSYADGGTGDGKVSAMTVTFTETLDTASVLGANDLTFTNVGDFTAAAFGSDATDLVTSGVSSVTVTLGTGSTAVDTRENSGTIAVSSQNLFSLTDGTTANTTLGAQTQATFLDTMKPVITSTTPTDASSVQSRTNALVWNFSEAMATAGGWTEGAAAAAEFEASPDPGGWGTPAWSNSDKTVTISHAPFLCITDYTMTTDDTQINAANGESGFVALNDAATTPVGVASTFTTMSCGTASTSAAEDTETTYEIDVLTPNGGETLTEGEEYEITWEADPEGEYYIDLYYLDGEDYVEIATQETNDGSYTWEVPADVEDSLVKVVWTDLADELDSDTSDADFNDTDGVSEAEEEEVADEEEEVADAEAAEAPSGTGISPVTGEEEEITAVEPGDFITSPSFSTVYYVTEDFERRAFISSAVFFTYADSYDEIKDVTDATLTALTLGDNMLPNPGVVLVKVQSDAKTYAVDDSYNLRWITSEEVAEDLYGTDWADYIIDIEATFFASFGAGDDVDSTDDLTVGDMKTREEVSQ